MEEELPQGLGVGFRGSYRPTGLHSGRLDISLEMPREGHP